jgi:sulfide dehydrogenase cytochrome subunit
MAPGNRAGTAFLIHLKESTVPEIVKSDPQSPESRRPTTNNEEQGCMSTRYRWSFLFATGIFSSAALADINVTGIAITCNNCHGANGISAGGAMPSIGGQPGDYLEAVMKEFRNGTRYSTAMGRLLKGYSDAEIAALAKYYERKLWVRSGETAQAALASKGAQIHTDRCAGCHGDKADKTFERMPRLAGQRVDFIELELEKYAEKSLKAPSKVMRNMVKGLSSEDLHALAAFYGSQK